MGAFDVGIILLMVMFLLIFLKVPVGVAMGSVAITGIAILTSLDTSFSVTGRLISIIPTSSTLTVVPPFILMGHFAYQSGIATDFFETAYRWLGRLPGGLGVATTVTCAGFGTVSGSSLAAAATMSKVAKPEMDKFGYKAAFSSACIAASGTLGSLIPPSIYLIMFGILTEQSIRLLFMAGIIPGIISAVVYCAMMVTRASINPELGPRAKNISWHDSLRSLPKAWGIVVLGGLVLGGIYGGIFTPTEAGGIGAFFAFLLGLGNRRMGFSGFSEALQETAVTTSQIFVIIIGALLFSRFMALSGVPDGISQWIISLPFSNSVIFLGICLMYIIFGTFLTPLGMMVVTLPVIFPTIIELGYDGIWFGIIMIKLSEIAMITPPLGLNVYTVKGIIGDEVSLEVLFYNVFWFFAMDVLTLLLFVAFPFLVLWLPNMLP